MDERKLIRLGNSSFAISLPIDWVKKAGLNKGDEIALVENSNGELVVSPEFNAGEEKETEIDLNKSDEYTLEKEIKSAYVKGYDKLNLKGKNDYELKKKTKDIGSKLLSFELVKETKDSLVFKDFFKSEEVEIRGFIKRIDNNIREAFEILLKGFGSEGITGKDLENIEEIEEDINRLYMLISRIMFKSFDNPSILKKLNMKNIDLFTNWWFSFNLEHIGDGVKKTARHLGKKPLNKGKKELESYFKEIKSIYMNKIKSFYKRDKEMALKAMKKSKKIFRKYIEKGNKSKDPSFSIVKENLENLQDACYQNLKMLLYNEL